MQISTSSAEMATDGVGAAEVTSDGVGTAEVTSDGVGTAEMATDGVGTAEMATDGVGTAEMAIDDADTEERPTDGVPVAAGVDPTQVISDDMDLLAVAATDDEAAATQNTATRTVCRTIDDKTQCFATLKQDLLYGRYCDFTIRVDQGEVRCHKLVLYASSSYFQNIIDSINDQVYSCHESDISKTTVDKVLAWLYYSDVTIDEVCIEELLTAAIRWNLADLFETCAEFVADNISINNACMFYQFSRQHGLIGMEELCSYFIREQYKVLHETKQLETLTLQHFCEIICHDEINVESEQVIIDSILRVLQKRSNIEVLEMCYKNINTFKVITPLLLTNMIIKHTRYYDLLKNNTDVDQKSGVKINPRFWDELLYINNNYNICKYDVFSGRWIKVRSLSNNEVDIYTAVATSYNRIVMVGGESSRSITLSHQGQLVAKIPKLRTQMPRCGVTLACDTIIIVGGQPDIDSESYLNSAWRMGIYMHDRELKELPPMNHSMASPLVVIQKSILYVIGGINSADELSNRRVQTLNLMNASAVWKDCALLPEGGDSTNSGVVIYEEKVAVLTTECCMTYDDVADKWFVERYERQGEELKPVVYKDDICVLVKKDGKHFLKYYNKEHNEWQLIMKCVIPNVLFTGSLMIERRYIFNL